MSAFDPKRTSIIDASPDLRRRYSPQRAVLFVPLCFSDMSQCRPTLPTGMGMLGNLPTDPGQHQQYASQSGRESWSWFDNPSRHVGPAIAMHVCPAGSPCRLRERWNFFHIIIGRLTSALPLHLASPMGVGDSLQTMLRYPTVTRAWSTFGDGNAYTYREVVQSDKGIWVYSTFRRRWQRCVCPHLGC